MSDTITDDLIRIIMCSDRLTCENILEYVLSLLDRETLADIVEYITAIA